MSKPSSLIPFVEQCSLPYKKTWLLYDDEKSDDADLPLPDEVNITLSRDQMEVWDKGSDLPFMFVI